MDLTRNDAHDDLLWYRYEITKTKEPAVIHALDLACFTVTYAHSSVCILLVCFDSLDWEICVSILQRNQQSWPSVSFEVLVLFLFELQATFNSGWDESFATPRFELLHYVRLRNEFSGCSVLAWDIICYICRLWKPRVMVDCCQEPVIVLDATFFSSVGAYRIPLIKPHMPLLHSSSSLSREWGDSSGIIYAPSWFVRRRQTQTHRPLIVELPMTVLLPAIKPRTSRRVYFEPSHERLLNLREDWLQRSKAAASYWKRISFRLYYFIWPDPTGYQRAWLVNSRVHYVISCKPNSVISTLTTWDKPEPYAFQVRCQEG
jgi:hypothetical protein